MPISVDIKGVGKVNFPDEFTPEQIQSAIETDILPNMKAPESKGADMGFFGRLKEDFKQSGRELADAQSAFESGEQGKGQYLIQAAGKGIAKPLVDIGGETISALTPQFVEDAASWVGKKVVGGIDSINKGINPAAPSLGEVTADALNRYGEFKEKNPNEARTVESLLNIGSVATPLTPIKGVSAAGAAVAGTKKAIKVGDKAIEKVLPFAEPALEKLAIPKNISVNAEDLRELGKKSYLAASESGEVFSPDVSIEFVKSLNSSKPKPIAGKVLTKEDSRYISAVDEFKDLEGQPLSIDDIDAIDKRLSTKISEAYSRGENFDGSKLGEVQANLRNMVKDSTGGKALDDARKYWTMNYKMQDIENIFRRAEMTQNPATTIQTGFRNLAMSAKKTKAYTPEELKLIEAAAKGNLGIDAMRTLGSRLISTMVGSMSGGTAGAAAGYIGSAAARAGAQSRQSALGQKVADKIVEGVTKPAPPNLKNRAAQSLLNKSKQGRSLTKEDIIAEKVTKQLEGK